MSKLYKHKASEKSLIYSVKSRAGQIKMFYFQPHHFWHLQYLNLPLWKFNFFCFEMEKRNKIEIQFISVLIWKISQEMKMQLCPALIEKSVKKWKFNFFCFEMEKMNKNWNSIYLSFEMKNQPRNENFCLETMFAATSGHLIAFRYTILVRKKGEKLLLECVFIKFCLINPSIVCIYYIIR